MTRHFRITFIPILYSPFYSFFANFFASPTHFIFSFLFHHLILQNSFFFLHGGNICTLPPITQILKQNFILYSSCISTTFLSLLFFFYTFVFRFIFFVQPPSHSHISVFLFLHINPFYLTPSTRFITRQPHLARRQVYFFVSLYQAFVYYSHYSQK